MHKWLLIFLLACSSAQAMPDASPSDESVSELHAPAQELASPHSSTSYSLTDGDTELPALGTTAEPTANDGVSGLISTAMSFLGLRYRRGGSSAETGFDCSGFVRAMFQQSAGLVLPRSAYEQAASTQVIDKSELQPGDLVFFNTMRRTFSHVGIYVGDDKFIHSPRSGSEIRVESMSIPYWVARFNGARRVAADISASLPPSSAVEDETVATNAH